MSSRGGRATRAMEASERVPSVDIYMLVGDDDPSSGITGMSALSGQRAEMVIIINFTFLTVYPVR